MFFRFLLKRKLIVGLFIMFIFVFGAYGIMKLDKELFPKMSFDQTYVVVNTDDMPVTDVEQLISKPLEQTIANINGVESYQSSSTIGNSFLVIDIEKGKGEDVSKEIEAAVNGMRSDLHGVRDVLVMQASTQQPYEFFMDISGGTLEEMSQFAENIVKPRLESLSEVREVSLNGMEEKEITIELKSNKMEEYGITQEEVMGIIQQANVNQSIGELKGEKDQPTIRWNTTFKEIEDIRNISIPTADGMKKLVDIATIREVVSENNQIAWKNGDSEFIFLQIGRKNDVTQIEMATAIRAEVEKIKEDGIPGQMKLEEVVAQADYVDSAIGGVTDNILIGGVIAVIVLLLFLRNIRATFIITLSIPASILLTVLTMSLFDYSFNIASLMGLGLGIGMMVDASIVVLESIYKKKEQGMNNTEAVITGTKEVFAAVLSSMLTTIVVFLPIGILDDDIGKMVFILAIIIAIALISSVLVSFTWIPSLAENFLKVKPKRNGKNLGIIHRYGQIIEWITKKKRRRFGIISLFLVMFASSLLLLPKIPMSIMPDMLNRYAEVIVELEPGVTPAKRAELVEKMNKNLATITDVENNIIIDNINALLMLINMTPEEEATVEQSKVNEEILAKLRSLEDEYPISSIYTTMEDGSGFPVQVKVSGEEFATLSEIGDELEKKLKDIEGISFVRADTNNVLEEVGVVLNNKQLEKDNIAPSIIHHQLHMLFATMPVGEMIKDGKSEQIFIKNDISIEKEKNLLAQEILTPNGKEKLSKYISLEKVSSPTQIDRQDGKRYIQVIADIEDRDLGAVNRDVQKLIQGFKTEEGYTVAVAGDLEEQQKAAQDLIIIFAISLFLVFVVMAIQFNSLKHPIIILSIIPLTITGVLLGLFITQKDLNVMSGVGIVMLVGIVLNNGILLIDRVKQLRNQGVSVNEAIVEAGKDRIRPIFMTTLTTVGGMIPLSLATGASSGYQSPLAVVIISGLLFATMITLVLIPAIYLLFEDMESGWKKVFRKKKPLRVMEEEKAHAGN